MVHQVITDYAKKYLNFKSPMDFPSPKSGFNFDQISMDTWRAKLQYTPDAALLSQNAYHHIFVYDRLMEGYGDHQLISEVIQANPQPAFSTQKLCSWRKNLGKLSFPIALESHTHVVQPAWADTQRTTSWFRDAPPAFVGGIIYTIPRETFYSLDKYYRNGLHFIRKKVRVQIPQVAKPENGGKLYLLKMWVWMYVGRSEHWEDQLDAGMFFSPVEIEEHPLGPYSFFVTPKGEPPKEEKPLTQLVTRYKYIPIMDENRVVGNGFETEQVEVPVEPNPYHSQIDGASPVQRTINSDQLRS